MVAWWWLIPVFILGTMLGRGFANGFGLGVIASILALIGLS